MARGISVMHTNTMRIVISNDPKYLLSKNNSVRVLDFIGSDNLKKSIPSRIVHPGRFTVEEKERVITEYVEAISDIGLLNNYSIFWLCHPISEKNDLLPNNLLSQIVEFISFYKFISDFKEEELVILTSNQALIDNIYSFLKLHHRDCEVIRIKDLKQSLLGTCKSFLSVLLSRFHLLRKRYSQARKQRFLMKKLDRRKSYTIIRTWFDYRSMSLINQDNDVYFGKLPAFLKSKGKDILYFGGIVNSDSNHIFSDLEKSSRNPIVVSDSLLNLLDYLKAWLFRFISKYKVRFKDKIVIQGIDVDFVFKNYFDAQLKNHSTSHNFLFYLAVKKLLKTLKVEQFFILFENYAWEKVTIIAIRENSKKISIKAFQHAQIALSSTKFFFGKKESRYAPLPDKIITLGQVTRDFLVKEKNYPAHITVPGCALRHDYHVEGDPVCRKKRNRILVFGWTFERSIEMLNFLFASNINQDKYTITVCTHPNHPLDKLIPHLNFKHNGDFEMSNKSLQDNFEDSNIVVYSGSTTCLDALAFGLPVINVEFRDFISPDPLFCFNEFKWTVTKPEELEPAIEFIIKLSDDEYYSRQAKGFEFVWNYFYAVNEKNVKVFLD